MRAVRRVFLLLVAPLSVLVLSGCGGGADDTPPGDAPTSETTTPDAPTTDHRTDPVSAPADCEGSSEPLPDAAGIEGVRLARFTDPTSTTELLTNTGALSVVIIPDGTRTTLWPAYYADPDQTDTAAWAALEAVRQTADPASVPGLPPGTSPDQVFFVPPGWSVCATTGDLAVPASVQYLRDKATSAMYFTAKGLAGQLTAYVTPQTLKRSQTLVECAQGVGDLLSERPAEDDLTLYTKVIKGETSCRKSYQMLLGDSAEAEQTENRALTWLERMPRLLEESDFLRALAHR